MRPFQVVSQTGVDMRILELHIEVEDVERSVAFYKQLLPIARVAAWNDGDVVALVLEDGTAFGLWKQGTEGLFDGRGARHLHFAFQIKPEEYDEYRQKLTDLGLQPDEHKWPDGHRSLYFFDPDGHQGEFMTKDWLYKADE